MELFLWIEPISVLSSSHIWVQILLRHPTGSVKETRVLHESRRLHIVVMVHLSIRRLEIARRVLSLSPIRLGSVVGGSIGSSCGSRVDISFHAGVGVHNCSFPIFMVDCVEGWVSFGDDFPVESRGMRWGIWAYPVEANLPWVSSFLGSSDFLDCLA